ncbi:hypothetical protein VSU19_15615 [Verrucomicrobiales bacterium BCK34]|nr:hypothetical protein [Verrucomicrobiales bacterium BCK34]
MADWKKERLDLRSTILVGFFLAGAAIVTFGGIGFVVQLFTGNLNHFPATLGVVALSSCGVLILFPVVGLFVSLSNKSWYALKFWLVASTVSVITCFAIAMLSFQFIATVAEDEEDIERFIPSTKQGANP